MTVAPQETEQPQEPFEELGDPVELSKAGRFYVGAGGVALSGVGSWALIGGTDGAGTVAVFSAGVILICLSAAGVLPQKIWGKDMGLILRRAVKQAEERGEDAGRQEVAAVIVAATAEDELDDLVSATRTKSERAADAIELHKTARGTIREAATRLGMRAFLTPPTGTRDSGIDAIVEDGEMRIAVQISLSMSGMNLRFAATDVMRNSGLPILIVARPEFRDAVSLRREIARVSSGRVALASLSVDDVAAGLLALRKWHEVHSAP